jgi:N-acetylneuraminate lyase
VVPNNADLIQAPAPKEYLAKTNSMKSSLTGLIAAPFTAMNPDCSLNLAMIEHQARALAENNVTGAFICGTTGEGLSLTTDERIQIAEKWLSTAPRSLRIIVHVGHQSLNDSRHLAANAERIGACAFAVIAPTFFRVTNLQQLVDYCAQVADAAPSLPFYYYHMPAMTGADFPMHDFLGLASRRIPNLAGIKFTHENLMDFTRCLNFEQGRFNILFGRDEILLAAWAMGATGAVGSTYNYMPAIYIRMLEAFNSGDMETARRFQSMAIQIITVMSRHGGLSAGKTIMKMLGLDCGPVRAPLQNLSPEALESLTRELDRLGFPSLTSNIARPSKLPAPEVSAKT